MSKMNNLLISEPPLQVLPSLAKIVGLNEAIVLQQFHYWLERSNNIRDGYKWIYNSYSKWNEQFPFWSNATLRRTIKKKKKQGFFITANYNKAGFDKTKWYRIDYERVSNASAQNEQTSCSKCASASAQNEQTNTNRLPETTTETNNNTSDNKSDHIQYKQIIDYLNEKAGKHFRNVESNKKLIRARWHEGYRLDDFKKVIDNKVLDANDANSFFTAKYLQPSTLFGNKFDQYLNQQIKPKVEKGTQSYGGVEF